MLTTLDEAMVFGVKCNIPYLKGILSHPEFVDGTMTTQFIQTHFPEALSDPGLTDVEKAFVEHAWKATAAGGSAVSVANVDPPRAPWASYWRSV
jgi:pyruvate carboxylase